MYFLNCWWIRVGRGWQFVITMNMYLNLYEPEAQGNIYAHRYITFFKRFSVQVFNFRNICVSLTAQRCSIPFNQVLESQSAIFFFDNFVQRRLQILIVGRYWSICGVMAGCEIAPGIESLYIYSSALNWPLMNASKRLSQILIFVKVEKFLIFFCFVAGAVPVVGPTFSLRSHCWELVGSGKEVLWFDLKAWAK